MNNTRNTKLHLRSFCRMKVKDEATSILRVHVGTCNKRSYFCKDLLQKDTRTRRMILMENAQHIVDGIYKGIFE